MNIKQTFIAAVLATITTFSTGSAAQADCGLECWLSNTFSSRDWVGDWLKDTFGPLMDTCGQDDGKGGKEEAYAMLTMQDGGKEEAYQMYVEANKIVDGWAPGQKIMDSEMLAGMKPVCGLSKLVEVVIETKNPEALLKNCFVQK